MILLNKSYKFMQRNRLQGKYSQQLGPMKKTSHTDQWMQHTRGANATDKEMPMNMCGKKEDIYSVQASPAAPAKQIQPETAINTAFPDAKKAKVVEDVVLTK